MRRPARTADRGSASVEFVVLSVVLLVPLVYVLLAVFALQRAAFAVSAAAREAGRAYVTGASLADGPARADRAARVALADQLPGEPVASLDYAAEPGAVRVTVRVQVELPLAGRWARVPVAATHVAVVDRHR